MPDFLSQIVARKKDEIAALKKKTPLKNLIAMAKPRSAKRSFYHQLHQPGPFGINIIAEIKRASPSKGIIREDLDAAAYAAAYEHGGAAAISVLTDGPGFNGCIEDLQAARQASTLPVLRKDFLISAYQIYESALIGADALLLIVRILTQQQLCDYLCLSRELNMDALVEVFSETDVEKAIAAGARLIGINNRNLSTFDTDINTARRMANLLTPAQTPVAASGVSGRKDIENIREAGIWNFLIGESIVRSENPQYFIGELHGN